jgi:Tol biopolymer transport system component
MRHGDLQSSNLFNSTFSPDGRWMAYTLREAAGGVAVYVEPVPPTGARNQVSRDADLAHHPLWSPDGKELFFFPSGNPLTAVRVTTTPRFSFGNPVVVPGGFVSNTSPIDARNHDIAPDGARFVATLASEEEAAAGADPTFHVVVNWFEDLRQRLAAQ